MKLPGDLVFIIGVRTPVCFSVGTQCLYALLEAQNKLIIHATCSFWDFGSHLPIHIFPLISI